MKRRRERKDGKGKKGERVQREVDRKQQEKRNKEGVGGGSREGKRRMERRPVSALLLYAATDGCRAMLRV